MWISINLDRIEEHTAKMFSKIFAFCAMVAVCQGGFLGHSSHQGSQGHGVSSQSFNLDSSIKSHDFGHDDHSHDEHAYPRYNFKYSVSDDHTEDKKSHSESRDGDQVQGEYSLVQPDGKTRTVTYTADKHNGFKADVSLTGGNQYGHQYFDDSQLHSFHH